jgi:hypothetical protein
MVTLIVLFIVALLPFVTTWLTSPQELFVEDGSKSKKSKPLFNPKTSWKLTKKAWVFLGIALLTMFFAWVQHKDNEKEKGELRTELLERDNINRNELRARDQDARNEQLNRDSINNEKLRLRDSIANSKVEKSKNETISQLAKYGLKYDSSQKIIEKLVRDSSRKTIIQPADPEFLLCIPNGITVKKYDPDSLIFTIRKCVEIAQCKKINITVYFVVDVDSIANRNMKFLSKERLIESNGEMAANEMRASDFSYYIRNAPRCYMLYAWVKGSFMNSDLSKSFDIDRVYSASLTSHFFGVSNKPELVTNFIKNNRLE